MSVEDTVAPTRAERKKLLRSHPSHPRVLRRRVAALLIDLVALSYLQWLCGIIYGVVDPSLIRPLLYGDGILIKDASQPEVIWPVLLVITVVYFVAQEGLFATTLGKFLVGLRVTRMDGHRPKFVQILKRDIVRLVDQFPVLYLIGWLSVRSSPQGQRLGTDMPIRWWCRPTPRSQMPVSCPVCGGESRRSSSVWPW